ncbi:MAG: Bacterial antitoxin of ParD toxin-antitoxin type system [Thermomicrobiales bacterium]|nr:Bacterial antitoxin of ParD toxin-antitoxin type system [Thermomicrobiales bacterium]
MPRQLTPQHEALIDQIVASGQYDDPDQVVTEALRQLATREQQVQDLRSKLRIGLDELDRGEGVEWTPELVEQLSREADEMYRRGDQPDPDVCP